MLDLRSDRPEDHDALTARALGAVHALRQNPEYLCKLLVTRDTKVAFSLKQVQLEPELSIRFLIIEQPKL